MLTGITKDLPCLTSHIRHLIFAGWLKTSLVIEVGGGEYFRITWLKFDDDFPNLWCSDKVGNVATSQHAKIPLQGHSVPIITL